MRIAAGRVRDVLASMQNVAATEQDTAAAVLAEVEGDTDDFD